MVTAEMKQLAVVAGREGESVSVCLADTWVARRVGVAVGVPPRDRGRQARLISCQGPCWGTALDLQLDHT